MSGAYVAKAGLNYSLVMTLTGTSLLAGDAVAVIGSFRLNGTSRTVEPADLTITWTASIAGSSVNLRIEGVGSYGASVTSEATDSGVYWQSSVSLEFEDIAAATDQTLTVTCSAVIGGISVTDYRTITVPDYSLVVTGPAQVLTNAAAACVASFRADTTDKTAEPSDKTITWSATIDANPIDLRVGSSGGYAATTTDEASDSGTYWQASSSLEFDLDHPIEDTTMTVTGAGEVGGLEVNDTADIIIDGWGEIEFTMDNDYPYLYDWGIFYLWRVDFEIWVKHIPTGDTDWYKHIRYQMWWDGSEGVVSETVITETGTKPDGISIVFSQTGTTDGPPPWTGSAKTCVKVQHQQPDKKYIIKTSNQSGTVSTQQCNFLTYIKESSNGNVVDEETRYTITSTAGNFMQATYVEEDITLLFSGGDWYS